MKSIYILVGGLLLCLTGTLGAQVTIYTEDTVAAPGDAVELAVRADGWSDLSTAQFSLNWDPAVLQFDGVGQLLLPGLSEANLDVNFGTTTAPDGRLGFLWQEDTIPFQGITLENGSALFTLLFTVVGDDQSSTLLDITGSPTGIEIADKDGSVQTTTTTAGTLTVDLSSPTVTPANFPVGFSVSGNPVTPDSYLTFTATEITPLRLTWLSLSGQRLATQTIQCPAGSHTQPIVTQALPGSGTYILQLQTTDYTTVRRLLFVR